MAFDGKKKKQYDRDKKISIQEKLYVGKHLRKHFMSIGYLSVKMEDGFWMKSGRKTPVPTKLGVGISPTSARRGEKTSSRCNSGHGPLFSPWRTISQGTFS